MPKAKTTQQFIEEATRVHGTKFDYGYVKYQANYIKIHKD